MLLHCRMTPIQSLEMGGAIQVQTACRCLSADVYVSTVSGVWFSWPKALATLWWLEAHRVCNLDLIPSHESSRGGMWPYVDYHMPPIRWQQLHFYMHSYVCLFTCLLLSERGLCAGRKGFALLWHCHFHYVPTDWVFKVGKWQLCLSGPSSITKSASIPFWPVFAPVQRL